MDNRRRQPGDNNNWGFDESRRRSMSKKPPRGGNNWQPTVPNWEKKFCKVVGTLDWDTFLYKKRFVHLYRNIISWDDSAGEEAFHNAKKRFFAEKNGCPCDIPLPSPDLYIDEIDSDTQVDLDPQLDLDPEVIKPEDEFHEPVVIFSDAFIKSLGLSPFGWGDEDKNIGTSPTGWGDEDKNIGTSPTGWGDEEKKIGTSPTGWGDEEKKIEPTGWGDEDKNIGTSPTGWGDEEKKIEPTGWGDYDDEEEIKKDINSSWNNYNDSNNENRVNSGWDDNWQKIEGTGKNNNNNWGNKSSGWNKPRYESSRFMDSNYYKGRYKWRGGSNGKREAVVN